MIFITKLINYDNYNSFSGCDVVVSAQMAPINDGDPMKMHVLGSLQTISYSTHQDRAPVRAIGNINAKDYVQGQRTIAGTMVFAMFHQHWMIPLLNELSEYVSNTDIWSDELPALNLTITMANEYGYRSCMVIYGVKFIDDGGVMSINDLYTENTLQYVATGIQPLRSTGRYEHSFNTKVSPFKISKYSAPERSFSWSGIQGYNKKWNDAKYRDIIVDNPKMTPTVYAFKPSVYINEPIVKDRDFVLNIFTSNTDDDNSLTNLYLTNTSTGNIYDATSSVSNIWTVTVPHGEYAIGVKDIQGNKIDNIEYVKLYYETTSTDSDDYPIIIEVGDTNVRVLPNNNTHDYITLFKVLEDDAGNVSSSDVMTYEIATHIYVGQSNSKEVLIENLTPDTKYNLYTFKLSTGERSKIVSFRTFKKQEYGNDLLKEYVANNADILLCKDLVNYDFKSAEYEYNNIIDSLLELPDSDEKTELLFYAVKLQNELNAIFNESGNFKNVALDRTCPLLNKFNVDESVASLVVYKRENNKNYYVTKSPAVTDYEYNGKNNTRYFIQPILKDNKKSSRNDFICFTEEQKEFLNNYKDVNRLSELSFINYDYSYDNYNNDLRAAIKAANNLTLYKNLLPAPYAEVQDDILIVDNNYSDYVLNDYYLCIATPMDALDYTPIRKIKVDKNSHTLQLEKYRTGIVKDNYYLLWIQDDRFNNISPAYILSTYEDDIDIKDYNFIKSSRYIKEIKNSLPETVYASYLNNTILNILAEEEIKYKDLDYYIIQSLLILYGDQLTSYVMDDVVISVIDAISKNNMLRAKVSYDGKTVKFASAISSTYVSCINITADSINKTIFKDEYDINTYEDGYTILYLIDKANSYRSGYILVNNATKEVYASNIELEMIRNGR